MTEREILSCYGTLLALSTLDFSFYLLAMANVDRTGDDERHSFARVLGIESDFICLHLGNQLIRDEACRCFLYEADFFFVHNSTFNLHLP